MNSYINQSCCRSGVVATSLLARDLHVHVPVAANFVLFSRMHAWRTEMVEMRFWLALQSMNSNSLNI